MVISAAQAVQAANHDGARTLLCVDPGPGCEPMFGRLEAAGWTTRAVPSVGAARRLTTRTAFEVGLIRFDARLREADELVALLQGHPAEWIALLPRDALSAGPLRRLVAEHFFDFHTLPLDVDRLVTTLGRAHGMARIKRREEPLANRTGTEEQMIGASTAMAALLRDIRKVAAADAPVLIVGESGTGKELAARAIHDRSQRAAGPFVAINCGAIPATLIQSELFGYEKGAFSGALQRKTGRIEAANGGTLFLDEIGDLPLELQANLLRFLQERQIDRVGGTVPVPVDVRIVAATNVDLERAVAEKRFREDLYHRLNVLFMSVPSLRTRIGDVEVLARYYFEQFAAERRRSMRGFSQEALAAMAVHDWPGNVRELINRVRRALVMCEGRLIRAEDLGLRTPDRTAAPQTLREIRDAAERDAIAAALNRQANNLAAAARELGVSRVTLYRLIQRHGLRVPHESSTTH